MPDHVYKKLELTGSSTKSSDDAVRNAIAKAGKTIPLKWRVVDADQNPITDLTDVTVKAVTLTCATGETPDAIEEYAALTASSTSTARLYAASSLIPSWITSTSVNCVRMRSEGLRDAIGS